MNILFLTYHGFEDASGISKKMQAQIKGLRQNGHEVHVCTYDVEPDGTKCRYVDGKVIKKYGKGGLAAIRQRMSYDCIYDYCASNGIQFVYVRHYMNASPWQVSLFKRLKKAGIKSVLEVPTFPYDQEFEGFSRVQRTKLYIDQLYRNALAEQMEGIVTFSDEDKIFGQRTIKISNGVDLDSIPLHSTEREEQGAVNLVAVAEVHSWHGFDRLVHGLGLYYDKYGGNPPRKVFFHLVGDVWPAEMNGSKQAPGFAPYIKKYGISENVIFYGKLFGEELDAVFDKCSFAIGSLGRHRSGITNIKTLKNREYASRGLPFIYSECDSDFDSKPYVLKAAADETPIDVERILKFLDDFKMTPREIRSTVEYMSWKCQMQIVFDELISDE